MGTIRRIKGVIKGLFSIAPENFVNALNFWKKSYAIYLAKKNATVAESVAPTYASIQPNHGPNNTTARGVSMEAGNRVIGRIA